MIDIAKGFGTIWLVFAVNGAIGLALGTLIRSSAAALGVGLIYVLAVEVLLVRFIDSLNNGAYQWIGNLFVNQNATALTQSFHSPAFGPSVAPSIGAEQAVLVLFAYFAGLGHRCGGFDPAEGRHISLNLPDQPAYAAGRGHGSQAGRALPTALVVAFNLVLRDRRL